MPVSAQPAICLDPSALPPAGTVVAVAVSGGADSFSLLHLMRTAGYDVRALTVDHGLRPGAADEARQVAAWCAASEIPHRILSWPGEKPRQGIQAAARQARYRLMIKGCEEAGIPWLLTGHTADDQAETVFMRLRRGSGEGLAGMRAVTQVAAGAGEPLHLGRPLLGLRRAEMAAYAKAHDLPVQNDPSNEDEKYERIQVRALLTALEQQGILTVDALCRTAIRHATLADTAQRQLLADAAACKMEELPDGSVRLDAGALVQLPERAAMALAVRLRRSLGDGGPAEGAVPSDELDWAETGGGVISRRRGGGFFAYREPAAMLGRADGQGGLPALAVTSGPALWDRRWVLIPPLEGVAGEWCPLGRYLPDEIVTSTPARAAISSLPCLVREERVTHFPASAFAAIVAALDGWNGAKDFLNPSGRFEARSLFAERFGGGVIRY